MILILFHAYKDFNSFYETWHAMTTVYAEIMPVLTMQTLIALSTIEVIFTTDSLSNRKFIPTIWTNLHNLMSKFNKIQWLINIYETENVKI